MKKFMLTILILLGMIALHPLFSSAASISNEDIYELGVEQKIINPFTYPYKKWNKEIAQLLYANYEQLKKTMSNEISFSYADFVKQNNFGIIAGTDDSITSAGKSDNLTRTASSNSNINKFVNTIKAGDIIYTTEYTLSGFIGHAAMASSNNWIVEMPGGKNYKKGIPDNNNQCTTKQYITKHIKQWNYVYRLKDQTLAKKVAKYADHTFYSSKGTTKKDRHIKYYIDSHAKRLNPSYCSKLVYYSYYYGSGNLPVMIPMASITIPIPPANVVGLFSSKYSPKYVGKF